MTRTRTAGLALLLAALLVAGCGGGGDGEPTVTQTLHDELQAELDAALADLAEERDAKTTAEGEAARLEGELETAQASVARLQTRIATAEASVADLTAQLGTATTNVTDLTADLAMAEAEAAQLTADLDAAEAEVVNLTAVIGLATDVSDASATASLHAQLNAASAEAARLETLIGATTDAGSATGSLYARLNAANAEVTRLTTALSTAQNDLTTSQARVTELQTLVGDATNPTATSLRGQIAKLTVDLAAETAKVTALTSQLSTAETNLVTAQQQAATAQQQAQQAQQQAQAQVQGQEANQRAQNLKAAFPGGTADALPAHPATTRSPVTMTPTRGSLRLARGGYSNGTLSGNGLRSTTMALTRGTDEGKMVVYTDRELSRSVLTHFGTARNEDDMTRFDLEAPIAVTSIPHFSTTPPVTTQWRISHGVSASVATDPDNAGTLPTDAIPDNTKRANSYTAYLYGSSGRFVCEGTNCKVQLVPTYSSAAGTNNRHSLQSVAISSVEPQTDGSYSAGGTLYFEPGSSTYQLYEGGPVGEDAEYMVFGYWREDPTSAAGVYQFKVFAEAEGTGTPSFTGVTATSPLTYDGVAVGAYVEQDPNDPVDTHRQGEFTADVFLTAVDADTVYGTIDDFVTTPTGGSAAPRTGDRWVLTLINGTTNLVHLNLAGGGTRGNPADGTGTATTTQGSWTHNFVPSHANAAGSDTEPPAVTGIFDARIVDFVHILGAYGAQKR